MRIACVGGGPAGLYASILFKLANPKSEVVVYERNRLDDTFGFGVVFSDATLGNLEAADPQTLGEIRADFAHWDAIDTHVGGEVVRSVGHGFCGLERKRLLEILKSRCEELGVELNFNHPLEPAAIERLASEVDLLIAADGLSSSVRDLWPQRFRPEVVLESNRFVWLGTTFPYPAFTFYFKEAVEGLWRIHAYRYSDSGSTFIAECTAETFAKTGLAEDDEGATIGHLEAVFAAELDGHRLIRNRSHWRRFPTVRNRSWRADNIVLVGDAAHTAHFSIGSGTKLAMEDCIALARELGGATHRSEVSAGLERYEAARRPRVERLQDAAEVSLEWFENTERYLGLSPLAFTYSLLTRSLRVSHDSLLVRDGQLAREVLAEFSGSATTPAHQTPLAIGDLRAESRLATLTANGLELAGGQTVPFGDAGSRGHYAQRMSARSILDGKIDLRRDRDPTSAPIAIVESTGGEPGAALRDVARASDIVRNVIGVPVVACLNGAALSDLETLLLARRADVGVL